MPPPEILDRLLEFLIEEFKVVHNVRVVKLPGLQELELFEHFTLHHGNRVLVDQISLLRLLQNILQK